jgi:hypothetical protein
MREGRAFRTAPQTLIITGPGEEPLVTLTVEGLGKTQISWNINMTADRLPCGLITRAVGVLIGRMLKAFHVVMMDEACIRNESFSARTEWRACATHSRVRAAAGNIIPHGICAASPLSAPSSSNLHIQERAVLLATRSQFRRCRKSPSPDRSVPWQRLAGTSRASDSHLQLQDRTGKSIAFTSRQGLLILFPFPLFTVNVNYEGSTYRLQWVLYETNCRGKYFVGRGVN